MATNAEKLKSIVDQGKEMAAAGHFDSASILKAVQDFDKRWDSELLSSSCHEFLGRVAGGLMFLSCLSVCVSVCAL